MASKILKTMVVSVKAIVVMGAILGLVACGGASKRKSGSEVIGVGDNVQFFGTNLSPEQEKELLAQRTYYFGYDSNEVSENDTLSVYVHAKRLMNSPNMHVRVEGHTDERGSREYNVALGERRANAIANILMLKGVAQNQISVVSYGKEKPALAGHDESSWSQNRRVVIVYEVE